MGGTEIKRQEIRNKRQEARGKRQDARDKMQETRDKQPIYQASLVFCRSDKDRRDASDKATNLVAFFET